MATTTTLHAPPQPASSGPSCSYECGLSMLPGITPNGACPELPVIELDVYLRDPSACMDLCRTLASCLSAASAIVVRDPRVNQASSNAFLDMMEDYFDQPREAKMPDVHPELAYQVGATPDHVERPRCLNEPSMLSAAGCTGRAEDLPTAPEGADAKWRFFWRLGPRPARTEYAELNAAPVVPAAFPCWAEVMDAWGAGLLRTGETVAEMAARGWGLEPDAFTSRMRGGPHLLAPTGVDLGSRPRPGTVFAGFHTDLNFLTVHGASRYPGLFVWLRDGRRLAVHVPPGCILLQAGTQLEHLTGGAVKAGFHEVICVPDALEAAQRAEASGRPSWRVSSTVFTHLASDSVLRPLGKFATPAADGDYPPVMTGKKVQDDLAAINLSRR